MIVLDIWKLLLYGIFIFIALVYIFYKINVRKQKKGLDEARVRGIKKALLEKRQYDALEKFENSEEKPEPVEGYKINKGYFGSREDV